MVAWQTSECQHLQEVQALKNPALPWFFVAFLVCYFIDFSMCTQKHASKQHRAPHSGLRTKSGHVIFQPAPAKSWESGQRPRNLHPHEMPWARTGSRRSSLSPQKSVPKPLRPSASTVASLVSDASLDAAILAEEMAKQEEAAKAAAEIAAAAEEGHNKSAVCLSISKQACTHLNGTLDCCEKGTAAQELKAVRPLKMMLQALFALTLTAAFQKLTVFLNRAKSSMTIAGCT